LDSGRKWTRLNVFFDERDQWIFFVGRPTDDQPLTFVLPISSDEQLTIDELFNLRMKLSQTLKSNVEEEIHKYFELICQDLRKMF